MMNPMMDTPAAKPLSVSMLTGNIKDLLEQNFGRLCVAGEISNFKRASSGHFYFSLKDSKAQIRCNMWRSYTGGVRFRPADGVQVQVWGSVSVYPPRGEYSLNVEFMEELGKGRLELEFERLKARLGAEGLFDPSHKKPLPFFPRKVGLVTSPTGAALQDMLRVLRHRFEGLHILIYPARVQGDGAAEEIAAGIQELDRRGDCDVIIAGRGGGSREDLWSFNEEVVARAIFAARTPIISAVGHEVDFTIADFTADVRAATPSNAAELVVRSKDEYRQVVEISRKQLDRAIQRKILLLRNRIQVSESHPIFMKVRSRVHYLQRHLAELEHKTRRILDEKVNQLRLRLTRSSHKLQPEILTNRLERLQMRLENADRDVDRLTGERLEDAQNKMALLIGRLADLSPLKAFSRGYAAVYNQRRQIVRKPEDVKPGEVVKVRLAEGQIKARVIEETRAEQQELF